MKSKSDDQSFWAAREFARDALVAILLFMAGAVSSLGGNTKIMTPMVFVLVFSATYYLFTKRVLLTACEKTKQAAFNCIISSVPLVCFAHFLLLAVNEPATDLTQLHTTDRVLLMRMKEHGSIPPIVPLFSALPLLATPAGMNIHFATKMSFVNSCLFLWLVVIIHRMDCGATCTAADAQDRLVSLYCDIIFYVVFYSMCYFSCVPASRTSFEFMKLLRASQLGDSVLNHILKNSIAGATCLIELHEDSGSQEKAGREAQPPTQQQQYLSQALEQLYRTMKWCASRQVLLDLAGGSYRTKLDVIDLNGFLRGMQSAGTVARCEVVGATNNDGLGIAFDERMARLALENALSNAVAHGMEGGEIRLGAEFRRGSGKGRGSDIVLSVSNPIARGAEISSAQLKKLRADADVMPHHEDEDIEGPRIVRSAAKKVGKHGFNCTNSGLRHIGLACRGAQGDFEVRIDRGKECTTAEGDIHFVTEITFPAVLVDPEPPIKPPIKPPGVVIAGGGGGAHSPLTGDEAEEERGSCPLLQFTGHRVCAIDDSKMVCKGYSRLLLPKLGADMARSVVCCPKTSEDVDGFVKSVVFGHQRRVQIKEIGCEHDVVILDQNIEISGAETVLGTDLARELRLQHYRGLVLIRSANSSAGDAALYLREGHVDGCLGKDESHNDMAAKIRQAFSAKVKRKAD